MCRSTAGGDVASAQPKDGVAGAMSQSQDHSPASSWQPSRRSRASPRRPRRRALDRPGRCRVAPAQGRWGKAPVAGPRASGLGPRARRRAGGLRHFGDAFQSSEHPSLNLEMEGDRSVVRLQVVAGPRLTNDSGTVLFWRTDFCACFRRAAFFLSRARKSYLKSLAKTWPDHDTGFNPVAGSIIAPMEPIRRS
jgi:hypothetical protein